MLEKLRKIFLLVTGTVVAVVFLVFAMVNSEMVTLRFTPLPLPDVEMRLFLFVGILILMGTFLGWIVASFECRRRYLVKKEVRQRMKALEDEVTALRLRNQLLSDHSQPPASPPPAA